MPAKKTDIMKEDMLYVTFVTVLSVGLLILGMNLAYQG